MKNTLFILNDPPHGSVRSHNALQIASCLSTHPGDFVRVFLVGEATACARRHAKSPPAHYDTEVMIRAILHRGGEVGVSTTCMEKWSVSSDELIQGCSRCSMEELATWLGEAERVLVF